MKLSTNSLLFHTWDFNHLSRSYAAVTKVSSTEFLEGPGKAPNGNLRQRHPRGSQLPLQQILEYVRQIADALQYAHDEKFIHRDIKPENMLLGKYNELLLSDFGVALIAQSSRHQSTQDVVGTTYYMAPEQFQGKPRLASDQYALGVVVYEWLSGDRPFHGSFSEIASQHMFAAPPPLRERVPTLPYDVEQVVLTALAKDPTQRFDSVRSFANALEQASRPLRPLSPPLSIPVVPQQEPPPSLSTSLQKETQYGFIPPVEPLKPEHISRHSIMLGTGVAIAAISAGGITWAIAARSRITPPPPAGKTSSPSPTPSPAVEGVANLSYSTNLNYWGINYDRPSSLDLLTTPPASSWIQPAGKGINRFYGVINFGVHTRMNIVLDQTSQINSKGYFDGQATITYDNDVDFSNKVPVNVPGTIGSSQPVEFMITYANGKQQKYAVVLYLYGGNGRYVLGYHRYVVRQRYVPVSSPISWLVG